MLLKQLVIGAPQVGKSICTRAFSSAVPVTSRGADGRILPHGGKIVDRMASAAKAKDILARCDTTINLNARQLCDVELLMVGGFSPLDGFMNQTTYNNVVKNMRLPGSDLLFGLPIVMDTVRDDIKPGKKVGLMWDDKPVAVLDVNDRWVPDKAVETKLCYGTASLEHPGVKMVAMERAHTYVGGEITGIAIPKRDFHCQTPSQVRAGIPSGIDVVAFQCRNPIHRAHFELFIRALDAKNVNEHGNGRIVLVHPTCGPTQSDDIPGDVRYQTYEVLKQEVNNSNVHWAYLPYSMHMAGPREAIQHMLIRKNYGCTHFIIGRDMAGCKSSLDGEDFYSAYDAQDFAKAHAAELGMQTVPSLDLVYTQEKGYITAASAKELKIKPLKLSGTEFRKRLRAGEDIPEWFAFKSVVEVLRQQP